MLIPIDLRSEKNYKPAVIQPSFQKFHCQPTPYWPFILPPAYGIPSFLKSLLSCLTSMPIAHYSKSVNPLQHFSFSSCSQLAFSSHECLALSTVSLQFWHSFIGNFCSFKPTILGALTSVHLLEYITVTITTMAFIAPVIIVVISPDFSFKIVYDIANLILSHFY